MHRRRCRADLAAWCEHALRPYGQAPARHHRLLIDALQDVAEGRCHRLMVFMPPGSAKSTYASHLFPTWYFARHPGRRVLALSHTTELAQEQSRLALRYVQDNAQTLGYGLTRSGAGDWVTTTHGRYAARGMKTGVSGRRAHLVVIDDPIRGRDDADSETIRARTYGTYKSDVLTRLVQQPPGAIIIVQTRWHQDDLSGRLLADMAAGADQWRVISLAALARPDDPLGRAEGEPLWPEWQDADALAKARAAQGERDWAALYQQDPRPAEGGIFKVAHIRTLDAAPAGGRMVRAWDLAATAQTGTRDPDWTVGLLLRRGEDGSYAVLDVVRFRGGPDEVEAAIVNTAARDGRAVPIDLPQDPGQAGKAQVLALTRRLAGYTVRSSPETGDKATRAAPFASQVNVGNVAIVRAAWNRALLDELATFPDGTKDDQVDAASRAFAALISAPIAMVQKLGY